MKISNAVHQLKIEFNISREISRYVYVYIIEGCEGNYLIDSGVKGCDKKIGEYIHKTGKTRQTINTLILTHSHPDHMGTAKAIKETYGCPVYSSQGERSWIEDIDLQFKERPIPDFYGLVEGPVLIDRTLRHGQVISLEPGITLDVINSSGHSQESLSFYYREEGILFMGDAVPVLGDIPIFEDSGRSIETLERLQEWKGVSLYCPAWDKIYDSSEGTVVLERAEKYMKQLRSATEDCLDVFRNGEADEALSKVCELTGTQMWREHPLFKRSVLSDLRRMVREQEQ